MTSVAAECLPVLCKPPGNHNYDKVRGTSVPFHLDLGFVSRVVMTYAHKSRPYAHVITETNLQDLTAWYPNVSKGESQYNDNRIKQPNIDQGTRRFFSWACSVR
jgi:hypothetical protein